MDLYDQVIAVFREVVGTGRQGRHFGASSGLTFGIRGADAEDCVRTLRERLVALNLPSFPGEAAVDVARWHAVGAGEGAMRRLQSRSASRDAGWPVLLDCLPLIRLVMRVIAAQVTIGRHIGRDFPEQLRLRAARLRRLDDVLGGGDTYRVYVGEYQATKSLLRDATYAEETRRGLLSVMAEQAQQAGWAAFDGGRKADARGLYEESHAAATEAGDKDLAGDALAFLAYQTVDGDRRSGVEIAARSCRTAGSGAPAGVRALLHERLAWACAVAGLADETERALAAAEDALSGADGSPQPDWASWVDRNELRIMTGRCWTELRRPLRAVPILEAALAAYDDSHARDKALYLSWLADSYLTAGEVEQAAATADRALDLANGVASVRPRARLAPLLGRLGSHCGLAPVDAVLARAAVI